MKVIICDIDGTIANNDHRQKQLTTYKDWDNFFSKMEYDLPYDQTIKIIEDHYQKGIKICFLTGRPERYREVTEEWLRKYVKVKSFKVYMRPNNDQRNKLETKEELFKENFNKEDILFCLENDEDLIDLWNSFNLHVKDANKIISGQHPQ